MGSFFSRSSASFSSSWGRSDSSSRSDKAGGSGRWSVRLRGCAPILRAPPRRRSRRKIWKSRRTSSALPRGRQPRRISKRVRPQEPKPNRSPHHRSQMRPLPRVFLHGRELPRPTLRLRRRPKRRRPQPRQRRRPRARAPASRRRSARAGPSGSAARLWRSARCCWCAIQSNRAISALERASFSASSFRLRSSAPANSCGGERRRLRSTPSPALMGLISPAC